MHVTTQFAIIFPLMKDSVSCLMLDAREAKRELQRMSSSLLAPVSSARMLRAFSYEQHVQYFLPQSV